MPANIDLAGSHLVPPVSEFCAGSVERSRGNQVIEDDRVLLSPAKRRDRIQIVIIEKMTGERCPRVERFNGP